MFVKVKSRVEKVAPSYRDSRLDLTWPWWIHPAWGLILLSGSMALISAAVPADTYGATWGVRRFLTGDLSQLLFICIGTTLLGILFTSGMAARGGSTKLLFSSQRLAYLKRAYRILFFLTLLGYLLFFAFAFIQGVSLSDLAAVLQRDDLAIYRVKSQAQTIPGLTTMTQFGPIAAILGYLLHKMGYVGRGYIFIVILSCVRVVFYSERLALIEVLVPLILVAALTVDRNSKVARMINFAPAIIVPIIWAVFAASEYIRSWVHYQFTTDVPFLEWVTLRLFGYYTTSFNNSALFMQAYEGTEALPYYTVGVFWNAPILSSILSHPGIAGVEADKWWSLTLKNYSGLEFNNQGSFLTAYAELGPVFGILFWLAVGLSLGAMFTKLSEGSVPGLLAFTTMFIGLLELPRLIYWTEGRAFPVILALFVIAYCYPREPANHRLARVEKRGSDN